LFCGRQIKAASIPNFDSNKMKLLAGVLLLLASWASVNGQDGDVYDEAFADDSWPQPVSPV
jgi:hypothetical protein